MRARTGDGLPSTRGMQQRCTQHLGTYDHVDVQAMHWRQRTTGSATCASTAASSAGLTGDYSRQAARMGACSGALEWRENSPGRGVERGDPWSGGMGRRTSETGGEAGLAKGVGCYECEGVCLKPLPAGLLPSCRYLVTLSRCNPAAFEENSAAQAEADYR